MALFVCEGRSENKKMPKVNDMYSLIGNIMIRYDNDNIPYLAIPYYTIPYHSIPDYTVR